MASPNDPGTGGGAGRGNIKTSAPQMGQHGTTKPMATMLPDMLDSLFWNSSEMDSLNYPGTIGVDIFTAGRGNIKTSTSQMGPPGNTPKTTTIVPDREYIPLKDEKTNLGPLRDNITVYSMISPNPRLKMQVKISKVPTDDSYVVLCTASSLDNFLGKPPVNLTLWQQQPGIKPSRVKTMTDTNNMRFSHLYGSQTKYICHLEGDAMNCLTESGASAKKPSEENISEAADAGSEALDWFLLIYAMELFLVISIIMWTVANFIHHVRLIMWAQKMIIMEQLDAEFKDNDSD